MSTLQTSSPVSDFVTHNQHCTSVFDKYTIDFCCGGQTSLAKACATLEIDVQTVYDELMAVAAGTGADSTNWSEASMVDLAHHILDTHHVYVKQELPRLSKLVEKVESVYKLQSPPLTELRAVWTALHDELAAHLQKEEQILFPRILELGTATTDAPAPVFHCGSVASPIHVMEIEHDNAGNALKRMRELTNNYTIPENACTTYTLMLQGLEAFEADLHQHVHKENNILFPKVLEVESAQASC